MGIYKLASNYIIFYCLGGLMDTENILESNILSFD